jgi:hypothetical protein
MNKVANGYKKYTAQAKSGIKGEAFFESMIAEYAIPHRVVGHADIGIDYFCEWVYGDRPAGVLFAVQVKTLSATTARLRGVPEAKKEGLNGLDEYRTRVSKTKIDERTLAYWKGLGIPTYLFLVVYSPSQRGEILACYYRRYTPVLHGTHTEDQLHFYKVSCEHSFLAFVESSDREMRTHGFARDLFIDCMRWNYFNGMISYRNPRDLGLTQFPDEQCVIFQDLARDYKDRICSVFRMTRRFLEGLCDCGEKHDESDANEACGTE